jgi:putative flippase GtrA
MPEKTATEAVRDAGNEASTLSRAPNGGLLGKLPFLARLTSHIPPGQFLRYLVVGGWNTLFGYGTYAAATALLMPHLRYGYIAAQVISGLLNITIAFLGYKFFVFRTKGNYLREWFRCLAVYGTGMIPGLLLLPLVVQGLHYGLHLGHSAPYAGGAILLGFGVIYSFLGHKKFSFRVPEDASDDLLQQVQEEAEAAR